MPTTDATNSGFTSVTDPKVLAQDPVVDTAVPAEEVQISSFDFSLDLPDSFSSSEQDTTDQTEPISEQEF